MECLVVPLWRRWVAWVVVAMASWSFVAAQTDPNDVAAMQALQKQWGSQAGWSGSDPCVNSWAGVVCTNNRVMTLTLISLGLTGPIPTAIGDLSALVYLDLSFNKHIKGQIPSTMGSLSGLGTLNLQWCGLSGPIPSTLGNLKNLTFFAVNNNNLSGTLPSELGALSQLLWFDVAYNNLQGPIPVSTTSPTKLGLDTWPNIQHYHMNDNAFSGNIPPEIGFASKVLHLLLDNNKLTGPIPDTIGNMSSLQILNLNGNQLSGPIPATLNFIVQNGTTMLGLHQIRLANNNLNETIPVFDALSHLEYVDFSNNSFNQQLFPSWLNLSMNSLQSIYMDDCNLIGSLPIDLLSFPALQGLYLRNNGINGSLNIPLALGPDLQYVYLQNNSIVSINVLNENAKLPEIQLSGNPTCSGNTLITASPTVCNSTSSPPLSKWTSPLVINNCVSPCSSSGGLTLNPLTCDCSYPLIVTLEIRAPTFTSIVNQTLWDAMTLQTNNSLHMLADASHVLFDSRQLWVNEAYYNGTERVYVRLLFFPLVGEVMDEGVQEFILKSFTQQKVAFMSPFKPEIVQDVVMSEAPISKISSKFSTGAIIGIAAGGALAVLLICLVALLAVKHKRRAEVERKKNPFAAWGKAEDGQAPQLKGAHWFSFDEIKRMTNSFSEDSVLGAGGYGKVYKGIQAGTGTTLAIKRAQEGSKQGAVEFKKEIEILSRVHHNNLVGLVGFCFEKSEQMLVYEYMPNGTLTDWLRGDRSDHPLDWDRRLLIALGAAQGISYLHNHADPKIIHRDVKSCNILLDGDLNAKVADFGLSMLVPDIKDGSIKPIKGTMGYLDPEYYSTNVLSPKSDVYSFGVVLLELLTARPPVSYGGHIVKHVRTRYDRAGFSGVTDLFDPPLLDHSSSSSSSEEEQETLLRLALSCVEDSSLERPSMYEVVKQLEALVGPKAQLMPGRRERTSMGGGGDQNGRMTTGRRGGAMEIERMGMWKGTSGGSSGSQQESFKYSGRFDAEPVQAK